MKPIFAFIFGLKNYVVKKISKAFYHFLNNVLAFKQLSLIRNE